jgi:hypothetical protein
MNEIVLRWLQRVSAQGRAAVDLFNNILRIPAHTDSMIRRLAPSLRKKHTNHA